MFKYKSLLVGGFLALSSSYSFAQNSIYNKPSEITPVPASLKIDGFYKKYISSNGIPIVSSAKVPDQALIVAKDIVKHMLSKRTDIQKELVARGSRVAIMAATEFETDLPERSDWKKPAFNDQRLTPSERENYYKPGGIDSMSDKEYWNKRARGMGGTLVSCAEENLLGYPNTKYYGENILVHEFSHNMMNAIYKVDPSLYAQIGKAYNSAKEKGMYKNQYAINTVAEYWAEGTQWWFNSNFPFYEDGKKILDSSDDLKKYDPTLYSILEQVYIDNKIPADIYSDKKK